MTGTDVFIVALGLIAGYAVVSRFWATKPKQADEGLRHQYSSRNGSSDQNRPWYEVLNVPPTATSDEIRRAYREMIAMYHPDKVASLGAELRLLAEQKAKEINWAYQHAIGQRR